MAPLISKKKGSLLDSVDMTNVSSTQKVVLPVGTPTQTPMTKSVPTSNKQTANQDEWTEDLIKHINKEAGEKIAFNLTIDEAPTNIKRWISTGSEQLNYIIKNNSEGGLPEGRIIELQGPPSCGKSHVAYECIKSAQRAGGIVVYIDTENATELGNLASVGIDVSKRFIFVQKNCIEDIFEIIESSIVKARNLTKDVPVLIVWDSIAQSSPKAELEGDYDQNTIGLAARVYGKGFRKVVNMIGDNKVTLLLINQQRQKIGVMFQDPTCVSPDTKIKIRRKI